MGVDLISLILHFYPFFFRLKILVYNIKINICITLFSLSLSLYMYLLLILVKQLVNLIVSSNISITILNYYNNINML